MLAQLGDRDSSSIQGKRVGWDLQIPMTRAASEAAISDDMMGVRHCFEDSLADAQVLAEEVSFATKTGGSPQVPS